MRTTMTIASLTAAIALGVTGCDTEDDVAPAGGINPRVGTPNTGNQGAGLSHKQMSAAFRAFETASLEHAQLASTRATRREVRELATRAIADQQRLASFFRATFDRLAIEPEENDASRSIAEDSTSRLSALEEAGLTEFDQLFLTEQAALNERFVQLLDRSVACRGQSTVQVDLPSTGGSAPNTGELSGNSSSGSIAGPPIQRPATCSETSLADEAISPRGAGEARDVRAVFSLTRAMLVSRTIEAQMLNRTFAFETEELEPPASIP
jgi:predicted outer membrane protein